MASSDYWNEKSNKQNFINSTHHTKKQKIGSKLYNKGVLYFQRVLLSEQTCAKALMVAHANKINMATTSNMFPDG